MRDVQRLTAGDSLSFMTTVAGFPASAGWVLHFVLIPRFTAPTQAPIELAATDEGDDFRTEVSPAMSAAWVPGEYGWRSFVARAGERVTLEGGQIVVEPDPAQATQGLDTRTDAAIALANVTAVINGTATKNVLKYEIDTGNGRRSLERIPMPDLIAIESRLKIQVAREENAAGMAAGLKSRRKIFGRVARA